MDKWNNVPGQYASKLALDENGNVFDVNSELGYDSNELSFLKPYVNGEVDITIHFHSSGYYLASSMYGGPDNLGWPAEGDDERTLVSVFVNECQLSDEIAQKVFDLYLDYINDVELRTWNQ